MDAMKSEKLEVRLTPRQNKLIRRAAEIMGTPVSRFLIEAAQEKADKVIRENMKESLCRVVPFSKDNVIWR
ncbi:DUF1778 domain-containing protein [Dethiosulfovibrio sp. F2B]|uniref:type II toxin-antitoxin system TacA family antitoxin n=1 Tax=Dethiosulfovibrio faecalis TaxID=2720018 RepID=UPI001F43C7DC|nr:DUF1778 domain-containing protein [Dethiosulfovibrio faecalis]MCF4150894.1 DUF1778 domain-containing protein [Dethiosulfovibrio faecalis]